jgi:hypothetical protein
MNFAAFLLAMVGPLAIRVLIALGFGAVAFTGITEVVNQLVSSAQASWGGVSGAALALASLAGVPTALGLIFGAFIARTTLWVGASAARLIFKGLP